MSARHWIVVETKEDAADEQRTNTTWPSSVTIGCRVCGGGIGSPVHIVPPGNAAMHVDQRTGVELAIEGRPPWAAMTVRSGRPAETESAIGARLMLAGKQTLVYRTRSTFLLALRRMPFLPNAQ